MDVNGTRYHMLLGERDWRPHLDPVPELVWDAGRLGATLRPLPYLFPERPDEPGLTPDLRRGAAEDVHGHVYWIADDERRIRVQPRGGRESGELWSLDATGHEGTDCGGAGDFQPETPAAPPWPGRLRGLAVTAAQYLVAGTLDPPGLLVFDLPAGGGPRWHPWPAGVPFAPLDLAPAHGGGLWVLDRDWPDEPARLWLFDRYLRPVPTGQEVVLEAAQTPAFKPLGGAAPAVPAVAFPLGHELEPFSPLDAIGALALAPLPDGSVLILARPDGTGGEPGARVHRFHGGQLDPASVALTVENAAGELEPLSAHAFAVRGAALQKGGGIQGQLVVADDRGNQGFAFGLSLSQGALALEPVPRYLPLRRFSGKNLVAGACDVFYDLEERWLPLAEQARPRFETAGALAGLVFDGRLPGCVWHRVLLDLCLPDGASVTLRSRAADDLEELAGREWLPEPAPLKSASGSEIPWHEPFGHEPGDSGAGTWELLFQHAVGRYVELELTFAGDGRTTPLLRALRAYYPRYSYLGRYLPSAYREDEDSASFLDRFLANVEGLFTPLEGRVARAEALFDVRTAPPGEFLEWLAGWLGVTFEEEWDDARRRLFLEHALALYRWRGTPLGLRALLDLAIDPCPDASLLAEVLAGRELPTQGIARRAVRIVESFQRRSHAGVELGDPRDLEAPSLSASSGWTPGQGAEPLHQSYRAFLASLHGALDAGGAVDGPALLAALGEAWEEPPSSLPALRLPPVQPADPGEARDWRQFLERGLGFPYAAVVPGDRPHYRAFLERRYVTVQALNQAHRLTGAHAWGSFADVTLPASFPASGGRLVDWIQFAGLALPIRRRAHRLTVLVPAHPDEPPAARELRRARVDEIVRRERPAHTAHETRLFWDLFQVGGARLGLDTVVGESARYVAMVLQRGYLGDAFAGYSHPFSVRDRTVLGRDPVTEPSS